MINQALSRTRDGLAHLWGFAGWGPTQWAGRGQNTGGNEVGKADTRLSGVNGPLIFSTISTPLRRNSTEQMGYMGHSGSPRVWGRF